MLHSPWEECLLGGIPAPGRWSHGCDRFTLGEGQGFWGCRQVLQC